VSVFSRRDLQRRPPGNGRHGHRTLPRAMQSMTGAMKEAVDFTNPPVTETMLGAWFSPLPWDASLFGLYRTAMRDRYPHFEDAPPVTSPGLSSPFSQSRGIYLSASKDVLVQVQPTMHYVNWRRLIEASQAYPRYREQQARFMEEWAHFNAFLASEVRPLPAVSFVQVCYVNHIDVPEGSTQGQRLCEILANGEDFQMLTRSTAVNFSCNFSTKNGTDVVVQVGSAIRAADNRSVLQLQLTSNRAPSSSSADDLAVSFDCAHDDLISTFLEITSEAARKKWGQQ